ncbi:MAG: hypothetical protein JRF63_10240, partial [Deltaproteobacteria bacterium]|nr:hypothetical protein [Deltaproteobacteria bacterium]
MRRLILTTVLAVMAVLTPRGTLAQGMNPPSVLGGGESGDGEAPKIEDLLDDEKLATLDGQRVVRVDVTGNRRVSGDDIRANVGTRRGMTFDHKRLARDIRTLYNLGFFSDIRVFVSEEKEGVAIAIEVVEKAAINEI